MLAAADGTFTVTPSAELILWTILIWAVLTAGIVTVLKGHWRWLILGLFLPPVLFVSACLPAEPDSVLGRHRARRRLAA